MIKNQIYETVRVKLCKAGVPNLQAMNQNPCQISGSIRLEMKCTVNVRYLNYPETILLILNPWKNPPGAKRLGSADLSKQNPVKSS